MGDISYRRHVLLENMSHRRKFLKGKHVSALQTHFGDVDDVLLLSHGVVSVIAWQTSNSSLCICLLLSWTCKKNLGSFEQFLLRSTSCKTSPILATHAALYVKTVPHTLTQSKVDSKKFTLSCSSATEEHVSLQLYKFSSFKRISNT